MSYDRRNIYKINEIMPHIKDQTNKHKIKKEFDGDMIKVSSRRLFLFKVKGLECVECGIKGSFFAKERHVRAVLQPYHFNLYGFDERGNERMLTKDHIVPKSKGGSDDLSNLQVMCIKCNGKKADQITLKDARRNLCTLLTTQKSLKMDGM
jgi:hypothetical protein